MRNSRTTTDMERFFCMIILLASVYYSGQTLTVEQKQTKADSALYTLFSAPVDIDTTKYSLKYPVQSYYWTTTTKRKRVLEQGYYLYSNEIMADNQQLTDGQEYIYNKKKMIYRVKYYKSGQLVKDSILKIPAPAYYLELR